MDFNQAIKEIQKKYEICQLTKDVFQIITNIKINEFNALFISIKNSTNPFLTDYGKTCELVNCDENVLYKICKDNNVIFKNYNIECPFNKIEDIDKFLKCLTQIVNVSNK